MTHSLVTPSPELLPWLEFAIRLIVTAALVVSATLAAERAGPLVGALIATLPISAGPAYVFVALEHDPSFIAEAALVSLAANAATLCFCLAYVVMAQKRGLAFSYLAAFAAWLVAAYLIHLFDWSIPAAIALNAIACAIALPIAQRFATDSMPRTRRRWYDVPFRTAIVAGFVSIVVAVSAHVGPAITGMLAIYPIVLSSLIVILQPRVGGVPTASLIAHGMFGTVGFATSMLVLHLMAPAFGSALGLSAALAICIGWNLLLLLLRRAR